MKRHHVAIRSMAALLGVLVALPAVASDVSTGNICEDQIRAYVARNFGNTVTRVEFRYEESRGSPSEPRLLSQGIAFAEECPGGYYFFEVLGDEYRCARQAQVGHTPNLIIFRSRGDGC